jgi:predicted DNA-binding protein with PD1-like motif
LLAGLLNLQIQNFIDFFAFVPYLYPKSLETCIKTIVCFLSFPRNGVSHPIGSGNPDVYDSNKQEAVMKMKISLSALIIAVASLGCGIPRAPQPASAPDIYTIRSKFNKVFVVRLRNGTDVLEGLQKFAEMHKIKNAAILSGIGSLTQYNVHVVNNTSFPPSGTFMKQAGPSDLLNVNGYIIDGRVHAHITLSDDKRALGGHLEPGTKVFTFAIITIGVLDEPVNLTKIDDYNWH